MPEQSPLERAARALCRENGYLEDTTCEGGGPMWAIYLPDVSVVMQALAEDCPPEVGGWIAGVLGERNPTSD